MQAPGGEDNLNSYRGAGLKIGRAAKVLFPGPAFLGPSAKQGGKPT